MVAMGFPSVPWNGQAVVTGVRLFPLEQSFLSLYHQCEVWKPRWIRSVMSIRRIGEGANLGEMGGQVFVGGGQWFYVMRRTLNANGWRREG